MVESPPVRRSLASPGYTSRIRHVVLGGAFLVTFVCLRTPLEAQAPPPPAARAAADRSTSSSVVPVYDRLGVSPFVGDPLSYRLPTMCLAAAEREEQRALRRLDAQLRTWIARPDTLPLAPQAARIAATCSVRWSVATTDTVEWPGLIHLALMANRDDVAVAIAARWQTLVPAQDPKALAERRLQIARLYETTFPETQDRLRSARAERIVVDGLGVPAIEERFLSHIDEDTVAERTGVPAAYKASVDTLCQMFQKIQLAADRARLSGAETHCFWVSQQAFFQLPEGRVDAPHIRQQYAVTIGRLAPEDPRYRMQGTADLEGMLATTMKPLHVQRWIHRPDSVGEHPGAGVPTVILRFVWDREVLEAYRRLYAEFEPRGVRFIVLAETHGFIGNSLMLPAAAEMDSLQHWLVDRLRLPGMVGLEVTQYKQLPNGLREAPPLENPVVTQGVVLITHAGHQVDSNGIVDPLAFADMRNAIANQLAP